MMDFMVALKIYRSTDRAVYDTMRRGEGKEITPAEFVVCLKFEGDIYFLPPAPIREGVFIDLRLRRLPSTIHYPYLYTS